MRLSRRFCIAALTLVLLATGAVLGKDKNTASPAVVERRDDPLQRTVLSLAKVPSVCNSRDIFFGAVCWKIYPVASISFDGQRKQITLLVNVSISYSQSDRQFTYAALAFAIDGAVITLPATNWEERPRSPLFSVTARIEDESLVHRLAEAHDVFVSVLVPDRISVKLSPQQIEAIKTLVEKYDALNSSDTADQPPVVHGATVPSSAVTGGNYPLLVRGDRADVNGDVTTLSGEYLDVNTHTKYKFEWSCAYPIVLSGKGASMANAFMGKQVSPGLFKLIIRMLNSREQREVECRELAASSSDSIEKELEHNNVRLNAVSTEMENHRPELDTLKAKCAGLSTNKTCLLEAKALIVSLQKAGDEAIALLENRLDLLFGQSQPDRVQDRKETLGLRDSLRSQLDGMKEELVEIDEALEAAN
jgi:hypothetical protein